MDEKTAYSVGRRSFAIGSSAVSLVIGFYLGIAGSDASDYRSRANDCYAALSAARDASTMVPANIQKANTPGIDVDALNVVLQDLNKYIQSIFVVANKCPMGGNTEYLNLDDVRNYKDAMNALHKCSAPLPAPEGEACSYDQALDSKNSFVAAARILMEQANEVQHWSVSRQAYETVRRFF